MCVQISYSAKNWFECKQLVRVKISGYSEKQQLECKQVVILKTSGQSKKKSGQSKKRKVIRVKTRGWREKNGYCENKWLE